MEKVKEKIGHTVELCLDEVILSIFVNDKLKADGKNSGYIQIGGHRDDDKNCWWDCLEFFLAASTKEFNDECKEELKEKGFGVKETRKTIAKLFRRAIKLNLLTV